MRTVQLTLEETLVAEVDRAAAGLRTTRSAFTRQALRAALARLKERALERKQREGYQRQPVAPAEFQIWETEQTWGEP